MRKNLPILSQRYSLDAETRLMSVTTPGSFITYANKDFIQVSGYHAEELMGEPHNIIRHPDMPPSAFADMWNTLKKSNIWTGIVKNRRKNGEFYWVKSSTTPLKKGDRLTGYMSVRIAATHEEIAQAEALYDRVNRGKLTRQTFFQGLLVYRGLWGWLNLTKTLPLRWRIRICFLLCSLLPLSLGLLAASSIAGCELLVRQVAAPLAHILQQAMRAAAGQADSMKQLDRVDEIGMLMRAVNQSGLNFRTFVDDVNSNLQALNTACRDIAQGNHTLSQCCEDTEDNLQQTAASVEQLTATIKSNADATLQASHFTQDVNRAVNSGEEAVGQVSATMAAITQSSARITDIISVLDDLAFQTNILALNAAVEAAHAGEQGRSFAVVAGEVRSLAQKSAASARDIAAIIDETLNTISAGEHQVSHTHTSMGNILQQVQRVTNLMQEISLATQEQSHGLNQINSAVTKIDELTHQNTVLASQSHSATDQLERQIADMARAISVFNAPR
ncbi:methyl-accepting chemotaxis protein [Symbiopectobacterium sp.]|uniref:methyl-accepting chemotaxis protein n=1 Tax=Symbiopectobacterium sp. TaxID=2952789 RepID=UPI003F311D89